MKQKIDLGFIIAFSYVIIYIVVKIYLKPNYDHFDGLDYLSPEFSQAVDSKRYELKQQQLHQYDQDKRINSLKNKVDFLRQDLKIIKSKDEEETRTMYNTIYGSDSLAQALSRKGIEGINGMTGRVGSRGSSGKMVGKNYNVNFNLDD